MILIYCFLYNFRYCSQTPAVRQHRTTYECWHSSLQLAFCTFPQSSLVTLPSALVYTADTFKAQDLVFYILKYRHVAGYMEPLVLQLKTPKSFQVPKQQNLFHSRQSFASISGKLCGDQTPTLSELPRSNFSVPFFPPGQHTFHWQKCFCSAFHT